MFPTAAWPSAGGNGGAGTQRRSCTGRHCSRSLRALAAVIALGFVFYRERVQAIQTALDDGRKLRAQGRFPEAVRTLHRGLDESRAVPAVEHLRGSLDEQLQLARRGQRAAALHQLAELVRFRHGVDLPSAEEARTLIQSIVPIWNERDSLLRPAPQLLDPIDRAQSYELTCLTSRSRA